MRNRAFLFFVTLVAFSCNAQHSISTNEIFRTEDNLFGVKSATGKQLIDPIYQQIRVAFPGEKKSLPPQEGVQALSEPEYYLVSNASNQKALFDKNGKQIVDFMECTSIVVDQATQTMVVAKEIQAKRPPRSFLYTLKGELIFDDSFEAIGYIRHSDLIALIAEDGANDEFYLYNPFEENKLGPFDHFNIYNKDFTTPKGIAEPNYVKYKDQLNVITVRREEGGDYRWGMIDPKGNEILPMEYSKLGLFSEADRNHPFFKQAIKPGGGDFIFRGLPIANRSTTILFDPNLEQYEFIIGPGGKGRIEKK
jgi:hypothetical protein